MTMIQSLRCRADIMDYQHFGTPEGVPICVPRDGSYRTSVERGVEPTRCSVQPNL